MSLSTRRTSVCALATITCLAGGVDLTSPAVAAQPATYTTTRIDAAGRVVGTDEAGHALLWTSTGAVSLITAPAGLVPRSVTNDGAVLGVASGLAYLVAGSVVTDLTAASTQSGATVCEVTNQNSAGQIAVQLCSADQSLPAILTPVASSAPTPAPTPTPTPKPTRPGRH